MKKHLFLILIVFVIMGSLIGCSTNTETNVSQKVAEIKSLNDQIDKEINDIVLLYRQTENIDEVYTSEERIISLEADIANLKLNLDKFNSTQNNALYYDSEMFEIYAEIIDELKEWEENLKEYFSESMSGLNQTFRIMESSNRAIIINTRKEEIDLYKPDYMSLMDNN